MSNISLELFYKRLADEKEAKNLSRRELSRLSGVPYTTIFDYLSGQKKPSLDKVEKLADALDVSPCYLAGWSDEKQDI